MAPQSEPTKKAHFFIVEDDQGRKEFQLVEATYRVGRHSSCDLRLHSQFVSRHHGTLFRCLRHDGQAYYRLMDGDGKGKLSANGLLVNGHKVLEHDLEDGDEVVFGPQVFAVYRSRVRGKGRQTSSIDDPFDITLIDPAMVDEEGDEDTTNNFFEASGEVH